MAGWSGRRAARGALAALLISVGLVSAPVSVIAFWTKSELIDTTRFVATLAPLATDPAFQSFLVEQVVTVVDDQANLDGIAADLFDGLATLGLPPRATAAVGLLEGPAVHGVRTLIRPTCEQVLHSECFVLILVEATRISHTQLLAALIPAVDRTVPLIQADALVQAQVG